MRFCILKFPLGCDKMKAIHQQNKLKDPPRENPPGTGAHAISTQKGPSQPAGSILQLFLLLGDSADSIHYVSCLSELYFPNKMYGHNIFCVLCCFIPIHFTLKYHLQHESIV